MGGGVFLCCECPELSTGIGSSSCSRGECVSAREKVPAWEGGAAVPGPRCRAKAGNGGSGAGWGQGARGPPRCPSLKEKRECVPGDPVDASWTRSALLRMYVMKCSHVWAFERAEENSHVTRFPCFLPTCPGLSCAPRLRGEHGCRPLIPNAWSCTRNLAAVSGPPSSKKLGGILLSPGAPGSSLLLGTGSPWRF